MGERAKPEEIIARLREVEARLSQGETIAQAARAIGVTEQTFYRWRKEYGGLRIGQAKREKEIEKENARLRRDVSDLTLNNQILQEVVRGKYLICLPGKWSKNRGSSHNVAGSRVLLARGGTAARTARSIGVTEQTYYRWRKEYGGLQVGHAKRYRGRRGNVPSTSFLNFSDTQHDDPCNFVSNLNRC